MLANMESASYNAETGTVNVIIKNSTVNGYRNTVKQYQTANTLSVPLPGNLVDLDVQAATQMQIVGYNSAIKDENYTIIPGEFTAYSNNWYLSTRVGGVEVQQANSANKENLMAGQSTNSVMSDILGIIIEIIQYLTLFELHIHPGGTISGSTGPVATPPPIPSDVAIIEDQTYIGANKNLFITGTYEPK